MSDSEEQEIGELRLVIDRLLCVGFGDCIDVAPDAFEFDDEGIAVMKDSIHGVDRETLLEACRSCPVDAITAFDAVGTQVAP